jgi:hypothetical protein
MSGRDRLCGICHLTCEIPHKAVGIEFYENRVAWFHDAFAEDCWGRLKQYIRAQDAQEARLRVEGVES